MKPAYATTFLLLLASLPSAHGAWQKVPPVEKRPVEVATKSIPGTKVLSSKGLGQADGLISDDPTAAVSVGVGASEAVIQLSAQRLVESVVFINDTLEGKATILGGSDKNALVPLGHSLFTPADRNVAITFAGVQVRYVKVELEASKGGSIRHFQVYGTDSDKDYEISQNESGEGGQTVNAAGGMGGSRVIYVHPSPTRDHEMSKLGKAQSKFDFPESDEKYRTVIYDLGTTRTLSEFGSVHSPRPVRLEVFAFNELPEKEDWKGRLSFDPSIFDSTQPVVAKEDAQGLGFIKVKTQKPVRARYVALRWEPDFNPPGFSVGGVLMGGGGFSGAQYNGGGSGGGNGSNGGNTNDNGNDGSSGTGGGGSGANGGSSGPYALGVAPFGTFGNLGTGGYAGGGGSLSPVPQNNNNNNGGGTPPVVIRGGGGGGGQVIIVNPPAASP